VVQKAPGRCKHRKRRTRAAWPGMMLHQDASTHEWVPGVKWDLVVTMDDPRVAVGPSVSLECGAWAPAETKCKAMRHGVKSLRESWRRAECTPGRTQDERGPPKAMAVA